MNFSISNYVNTTPLTLVGFLSNVTGVISAWPRCTHHHYVPELLPLTWWIFQYLFFSTQLLWHQLDFHQMLQEWSVPSLDVHIINMFHFNNSLAELLPLTWWIFQYLTLSTQLLWHQLDFHQMLQEWSVHGLDVHIIIMFQFNNCLAELLPLTWWMFQYLTLSAQLLWHQLDFHQMLQEWSVHGLDVHIIIMFHFNNSLAELLPLTWWIFNI